MQNIDAAAVEAALDFPGLVDRLQEQFRVGCTVPLRHHHSVPVPGAPDATLLLMPAWQDGRHIAIKLATVFPGNAARGLASVMGVVVLLDANTGEVLALLDAPMLTLRRTAAASALAARFLARADAARLLMIGTGALAPHLIRAHAAVRPIREVAIWGRSPDKARKLAVALAGEAFAVTAIADRAAAAASADIVSCATLSSDPVVSGDWLRPGTHIDLVGAFNPQMREADDAAVRRARVYVDTREGAGKEAGDIVQPLQSGTLAPDGIVADLFELCRGEKSGRGADDEITLFKSVGTALEDLAAAQLAFERS